MKGFAHLLVLVILLIGVGVGAVLVQQPNIFKSKACNDYSYASFSASYGACQGDPRYNSKYDLSGPDDVPDGCVNASDWSSISMKISQCGSSSPTPSPKPTPTSTVQPTPTPARIPVTPTFTPPQPISADIDVTYIERTPRYYRYCVADGGSIPSLCPGTENQKRWPDVGENITYKAHVMTKKNSAGVLSSGNASFFYQWLINGGVVSTGQSAVASSGETVVEYTTTFPSSSQSIQFKITPHTTVNGDIAANNALTIGSHDLTLSIWAEKGIYDIFNRTLNMAGTYSFEDWIESQFKKMNERFAQAKYGSIAPSGIKDRVRIDKMVAGEQMDIGDSKLGYDRTCSPASPMSSDEHQYLIDGRWQFTDGDCDNQIGKTVGADGNWQNYVNTYVNTVDWGLIHELAHQLGVVDLYRQNIKPNDGNSPNGGIHIKGLDGQQVPYSRLNFPVFANPGSMGGGDRSPYPDGTYFESQTAGGLNSNSGLRRGFYGEYLFDTPANTSLKVVDKSGYPIADAQIKLYQKDIYSEDVDDIPEINGTTDSQGIINLPNRQVNGGTTATGHTLKPNPFGLIGVVGTNGNMILQVIKNNKDGYGFLTVNDLNTAYYAGNRDNALITVKTNFTSGLPPVITPTPAYFILPTPIPTPSFGADTTRPTVYFSIYPKSSFVRRGASLKLDASASDNVGVKQVEFYLDNRTQMISTLTSLPYSYKWIVPSTTRWGFHTIYATVSDNAGNTTTKSTRVFVY